MQVANCGFFLNYSKQVVIPFVTNSRAVSKGEELILESNWSRKSAKGSGRDGKRRFSDFQKNKDAEACKKKCT